MRMRVALAALIALGGGAWADDIIGNLPGNNATQSAALQNGRIKAMGFTMPGQDYTLDRVTLSLNVTGLTVDPLVRIFDDGGGFPGNLVAELADPPITSTGIAEYPFSPTSPVTLEAGKTYWVVVYNVGGDSMDWKASSPSQIPTGVATHAGALFSTTSGPNPPTSGASSIMNSYLVQGTPAQGCYPDCDGSGTLDLFDFLCFVNEFNNGDPYADCDGSGSLDLFDFLCFVNSFNAGC